MIAASYFFYAWWDWHFIFLLGGFSVIAQLGALAVHRRSDPASRRTAVIIAVAAALAPLAWFKYYGFFSLSADNALGSFGVESPLPLLQILLPVGISFYTFMGISYIVDVYRRQLEPAGWLDFLYLSFFPHLVAGPIVRGGELLSADRQAAGPRTRRLLSCRLSHLRGAVQEGGALELPRHDHRRSGVRRSRGPQLLGDPRGRLRLRGADLRGLQRLHGHCDRHRAAARVRVPTELRPALHGAFAAGLLAPMAHDVVALVARLPLHPPGWVSKGQAPDLPQHLHHHAPRRAVARRGLELRRLGRHPRASARSSGTRGGIAGRSGDCRSRRTRREGGPWSASSPSTSCVSGGSSSGPDRSGERSRC